MRKHKLLPLFIALLLSCTTVLADNWAHWRGPTGNGTAPHATPPLHFSDTQNVKWKVPIPGRSSGSPAIWETQVFVVTAVSTTDPATPGQDGRQRGVATPNLAFKVLCFDRETGSLQWERTAITATPHQDTHVTNSFASASPCTDGERVYASFGSQGLFCYSTTGNLVWKRTDFGPMRTRLSFGEGSSPTLEGNLLLHPWDHEGQSYLYAIDKLTGETVWRTARDEPTAWSTPLVVDHQGRKQVVLNGQNFVRSYDLKTGQELWRCAGQTERPVSSAVFDGEHVIVGSGYRGAFVGAFKPDGHGDIGGTDKVAWTIERDAPDIGSPMLSEDRLYFYKGKSGLLSCVDAKTGKFHYSAERLPGLVSTYASPVAADGRVYLTDRSGVIVVIEDSPKLKILATSSMRETVDTTLAPVDDQIFIRGENHLFCIESQE
ncbi:outer membrane protein assembly factor BamB family protein [Aureliella helgolandensis]|uniref:Outer membrane biogenesis protein BamB n=1 Tax=Aureliella helgolandensis TaxID=2527968 RepID=A0A518FZV6_9BACT|nr:PQQ-binding-like beta-propeller repeat protein [Aureliella helgolandensis]QDV21883.1 outer membrane biogenesis protein BamB [Aureliella helgolandensis]